jgi:DNA modification methylase
MDRAFGSSCSAARRVSAEILHGDCLTVLPTLAEKSVQTCVTSPPYWGLRDYGVDGQLGLERTPDEYVAKMVEVFREVRRVLRDDGTLWLNLGDSYNSSSQNNHGEGGALEHAHLAPKDGWAGHRPMAPGLKTKDLVGIPWRVAFALQADGWYLRSDIIWHKTNPMPESVTDRPTKAHEYLFLLTKSATYYYDADAVREPLTMTPQRRLTPTGFGRQGAPGMRSQEGVMLADEPTQFGNPLGRNRRSVWTVATRPYKGAHFATFPPALIEPCILAGSSAQACEHCGAAWVRIAERTTMVIDRSERTHEKGRTRSSGTMISPPTSTTIGFEPGCDCADNNGTARSVVLDPFGGSGTTAAVATRHNRSAISIELNAAYLPLQHERLAKVQPTLGVA